MDSNGDPASGFVLKAYAAGTSTNINMATDSTGNTTATSIALNADGYPEVSGTIVIPHLEQDYKLSLYPTQAAADADSGATWTIDNLSNTLFFNIAQLGSVAGTDTITATSSPTIGSYVVNDLFIFTPANDNTGSVTLNIDSEGAGAVQLNGAALVGGELQANVPVLVQVTAVTPVFEIVASGSVVPNRKGADIASASDLNVTGPGNSFDVTGTTQIDTIQSKGLGEFIILQFDGALTLAHDGTNLILPGAADITTAAGDIAVFYEYASADWRCVSYQRAVQAPGQHVIQVQHASDAAVATGTTTLPSDDTIPQNTEGDEYITVSITPKSTTNRLFIRASILLASSAAGFEMTAALFQDSTAGALAATGQTGSNSNENVIITLEYEMAAGTTSSTTFKIRAGTSGAGTTTFNGRAGARLFGGVATSTLTVTEYPA